MTVCPHCGKSFPEGETFCRFCGCAAPEVEPATPDTTSDDAANPYAVGARTTNRSNKPEARVVPSNMLAAVKTSFARCGSKGRSSRAEFWYWILFLFLTVFCPYVLSVMSAIGKDAFSDLDAGVFIFANLWALICAIPTLTLAVRRFHDANISGTPLYMLFSLIVVCPVVLYYREGGYFGFVESPLVGRFFFIAATCLLAVLVVALKPGTKGENKYGPPPVKRR